MVKLPEYKVTWYVIRKDPPPGWDEVSETSYQFGRHRDSAVDWILSTQENLKKDGYHFDESGELTNGRVSVRFNFERMYDEEGQ